MPDFCLGNDFFEQVANYERYNGGGDPNYMTIYFLILKAMENDNSLEYEKSKTQSRQ